MSEPNDPNGAATRRRPSNALVRRVIAGLEQANAADRAPEQPDGPSGPVTPWLLQRFLDGLVDLEAELADRYPHLPLLSVFKARSLYERSSHQVATLSAPDDAASVVVDIDAPKDLAQFTFAISGMFSRTYTLDRPSSIDRPRWLEAMDRRQGGLTFLWGVTRWEGDYLICVLKRYQTNVYAFSPAGVAASVRLTPDVTRDLLAWMRKLWTAK